MDIIKLISENKEWLFSGVGIIFFVWLFNLIKNKIKSNSDLITVTISGGAFLGPDNDTPKVINKNDISSLDNPYEGEIGNTVIVMRDGSRHYVTESKSKIQKLSRK
jgi:hypothetical protein